MAETNPSPESSLDHVYHAAEFLAREGEHDLAIALLRKALVRVHVARHVGRAVNVGEDERVADSEKRLAAQYAAFRLKHDDDRKPWVQTLVRTGVISGFIALTFLICFTFAIYRLDALIASPVDRVATVVDNAVKSELPRMTNRFLEVVPEVSAQMNKEIQNVSTRFSEYIEKRVDVALDERITAIVDERLKARLDAKK